MGSPTLSALFVQRVVVGVGDVSVSNNALLTLSTYALGSCVAVAAYDPVSKAGGLLHLMLPDSTISPDKAITQPAMFADTGLPLLFRSLTGMKAERARLRLFVAGGASVLCDSGVFKIGERNVKITLGWLQQNGFNLRASAVGGTINRTVHLELNTGGIELKTPAGSEKMSLGG
jgi:chemotaxis protein CheD